MVTPGQDVISRTSDWQRAVEERARDGERRAWSMVRVMMVVTAMAMFAVAALAPLKSVVPYLVYVDRMTGESQVVEVLDRRTASSAGPQDKHWATNYVRLREEYIPALLQFDYDRVYAASDAPVARTYGQIYEGDDAREKRLGDHTDMRVEILSVTLPPVERGRAIVRFERTTRKNDVEAARERFVATLQYEFRPAHFVREEELIENPLGFRVLAYTVDAELGEGPAPTVDARNRVAPP